MTRRTALIAAVALASAAFLTDVPAAPVADTPPPTADASAEQIIEQLAPPRPATRGLRNLVPAPRQIDLVVQFDFDSAQLQPASRPLLQRLAEAMASPRLEATRFRVEGHTDAKGSARRNAELSAQRAQAVAAFLQAQGVAAARLQAEGKGASELLDPARPEAAANRRVRIVAWDDRPAAAAAAAPAAPWLVSEAEAAAALAAPTAPDAPVARAAPVPDAPRIHLLAPSLAGAVPSPTRIALRFEPVAPATVRPDSLRVRYGALRLDITSRVTGATRVTADGIDVAQAQLPRGAHRLVVEIQDSLGRSGERELNFVVE